MNQSQVFHHKILKGAKNCHFFAPYLFFRIEIQAVI